MSTIVLTIIFAAAILFFCWLLAEYWLRDSHYRTNEGKRLRFGTRTAFALTHFWKAVDDVRDIPKETVKEEFAGVSREQPDDGSKKAHTDGKKNAQERGPMQKNRRYNIKENM